MKRFEYTTFTVKPEDEYPDSLDEQLNKLGEEGWELVTAVPENNVNEDRETYTAYIWYTFKREIE